MNLQNVFCKTVAICHLCQLSHKQKLIWKFYLQMLAGGFLQNVLKVLTSGFYCPPLMDGTAVECILPTANWTSATLNMGNASYWEIHILTGQ